MKCLGNKYKLSATKANNVPNTFVLSLLIFYGNNTLRNKELNMHMFAICNLNIINPDTGFGYSNGFTIQKHVHRFKLSFKFLSTFNILQVLGLDI